MVLCNSDISGLYFIIVIIVPPLFHSVETFGLTTVLLCSLGVVISCCSVRGDAGRSQTGSAIINIVSVTVADQGVYTCVADNGQGREESRIQVTGLFDPSLTFT